MNPTDDSFAFQLPQWASRQLADYDDRAPGKMFAEGVTLDVKQAYRLQSAVARLRSARGEKIIGYKVGCTSPVITRTPTLRAVRWGPVRPL